MFNLRPPGQKPLLGTPIDWSNPLSRTLVAAWTLLEGSGDRTFDVSGNGSDGTIIGAGWEPGGLYFDGTSDSVDLGRPEALNFTPRVDYFSLFFIFKTAVGAQGTIYSFGAPAQNQNRQIQVSAGASGKIDVRVGGTNSIATSLVNDGSLHSVAMTVPASTTGLKLYIDGIFENFSAGSGGIGAVTSGENGYIGARTDGQSYELTGNVYCGFLFSQVLTPYDVTLLHTDPYQMWPDYALWMAGVMAGWPHKWNGIAGASIATINGVPSANIAKVNGI
ncbi:hypothetical protein LCGC14_1485910 [marine sediment metagenome]|uniref:LamG-like jellyroll fold domain-containing protein n=1 Tax=marine sediment metagenome TaxID=412755 RepID=A0A0F9MA24_9ZZZZ